MIRSAQDISTLVLLAGSCVACRWMEPADVEAECSTASYQSLEETVDGVRPCHDDLAIRAQDYPVEGANLTAFNTARKPGRRKKWSASITSTFSLTALGQYCWPQRMHP